jgi:septal ring factor EnvC (AmiA/AmiB activator)
MTSSIKNSNILGRDLIGVTDLACYGCSWLKQEVTQFEAEVKNEIGLLEERIDDLSKESKGNMEMIKELGKENEAIKNMIRELKSEKEGQATVIPESKKIIARFKGQVGRLMNQNRVLVKENRRLDQMIKKVQAEAWEREDSLVLRVMMVEFRHRKNTLQLSPQSKRWLFKKVGRLNLPRFQNFIEQILQNKR